ASTWTRPTASSNRLTTCCCSKPWAGCAPRTRRPPRSSGSACPPACPWRARRRRRCAAGRLARGTRGGPGGPAPSVKPCRRQLVKRPERCVVPGRTEVFVGAGSRRQRCCPGLSLPGDEDHGHVVLVGDAEAVVAAQQLGQRLPHGSDDDPGPAQLQVP